MTLSKQAADRNIMDYRDTFKQWVSTLDKCDLVYRMEYTSENDKEYLEHIFGVDFIRAFEEVGYAGGIEMPWTAETLSFFALSEIVEAQAGYRFDASWSACRCSPVSTPIRCRPRLSGCRSSPTSLACRMSCSAGVANATDAPSSKSEAAPASLARC